MSFVSRMQSSKILVRAPQSFLHHPLEIWEVLGKGSHGVVYRGWHRGIGKEVAIKHTMNTLSARKEIQFLRLLAPNPHIVKLHDVFFEQNELLLALEYIPGACSGKHLIELVQQGTFLVQGELRMMVYQLALGLLCIHDKDLVMGDIKPDNFLYIPISSQKAQVRWIDLGCCRPAYDVENQFKNPIGTPLYFAPEKFERRYGKPSDVWSLGVVFYLLFSGQHPLVSPTVGVGLKKWTDLYEVVKHTPLRFESGIWDHVSPTFRTIVQGMLLIDPSKRYTMPEVIQLINLWMQEPI